MPVITNFLEKLREKHTHACECGAVITSNKPITKCLNCDCEIEEVELKIIGDGNERITGTPKNTDTV